MLQVAIRSILSRSGSPRVRDRVRPGQYRERRGAVVAPAIGEALITTAIGLAAAIPAVFFYNWIDKRVGDFLSELEASAAEWVAIVSDGQTGPIDSAIPLVGGRR